MAYGFKDRVYCSMKNWSVSWKSSKKPVKQRVFRYRAPLHIKSEFLNVHLSKELRNKFKFRSIRVRVGDTVKVMRGNSRGKVGKVERVDVRKEKVFITGFSVQRRDGSPSLVSFNPSNLLIQEFSVSDKRRVKHV